MNNPPGLKNDLYYTHDHEWIDFQGSVAYVGVGAFKLTGIRKIQRVEFAGCGDRIKAEDVLTTIFSVEYKITIHMPVDAEVLCYNEQLSGDNREILLQQPEKNGWIAFIFPISSVDRKDLLLPEQYLLKNKRLFN